MTGEKRRLCKFLDRFLSRQTVSYISFPPEKTGIDELKIYHVISLKGEKYCFSPTPNSNAEYVLAGVRDEIQKKMAGRQPKIVITFYTVKRSLLIGKMVIFKNINTRMIIECKKKIELKLLIHVVLSILKCMLSYKAHITFTFIDIKIYY